jgi:signal transduction histidine kinase
VTYLKIIEAHGGRIWVKEGQTGKGTTVCFTLPEPEHLELAGVIANEPQLPPEI